MMVIRYSKTNKENHNTVQDNSQMSEQKSTLNEPIQEASNIDDLNQIAATIINLNGFLCAEVVDTQKLKVRSDIYEVTCIEYRGGSSKKSYIMDVSNGTVWTP